jgi:DNA polymerase III delta prime subunit
MELLLHPNAKQQVDHLSAHPGGSIVLHGPAGVGKRTTALEIGRRLNCGGCKDQSCSSCLMIKAGNHPDVIVINPDDKGKIGIEAIHELGHQLQFNRYQPGSQRVVVIAKAETMTLAAQNALLKPLEEPPAGTTIIITTVSLVGVLETIVSRCRPIYVPLMPREAVEGYIKIQLPLTTPDVVEQAALLSHGAVGTALNFIQDNDRLDLQQDIYHNASTLMAEANLYERLILATRLAAKSDMVGTYLEELTHQVRQSARSAEGLVAANLSAVERLRTRLAANVNAKTAFQAFAAEVVC